MFKHKTLFIIGAGASKEAGLPLGNQLTSIIAEKVRQSENDYGSAVFADGDVLQAIKEHCKILGTPNYVNDCLRACRRITRAMPNAASIDRFIADHGDDKAIEICGKIAIVSAILEAERGDTLIHNLENGATRINYERSKDTWYPKFFQILQGGLGLGSIQSIFDSVAVISFNYDRCLEQYLFCALQDYYSDVDPVRAASLMETLKTYHPYGTVGKLPWQGSGNTVDYGAVVRPKKMLRLSEEIKTFGEQMENTNEIETIRNAVLDALVIVFLGFGYHEQNLKLIRSEKRGPEGDIFGTTFGYSDSSSHEILLRLQTYVWNEKQPYPDVKNIRLHNTLNCRQLLDEYELKL